MAKQKKQLQKLFDELSANLYFYRSDLNNKFMCPICLNIFNSLDELSKAHIIPESLGGRSFTLACKKCNNSIGSFIESYEAERVKFNRTFSGDGKSSWKANLSQVGDQDISNLGKVTADMTFLNNDQVPTFNFEILNKGSSPKAISSFTKDKLQENTIINIDFSVRGDWTRAKLTYLHAAYLFVFSQLGYEWVLDPSTKVIREQILNPERELIPFAPIYIDTKYTNNFQLISGINNHSEFYWYLIVKPIESVGFLVIFPSLDHFDSPIGVWLPLPGRSYENKPKVINFHVKQLPLSNHHLSNPESIYLGIKLFLKYFFD